jgi:hypothetical protein
MLPNEILLIIYKYSDIKTRINFNRAHNWSFRYINPYKDSIKFVVLKYVMEKTTSIEKHRAVIVYNILKYIRRLQRSKRHRSFLKYILNEKTKWLDTKIKYELFLECIRSECVKCF